jgi:hypothetical protein
MIRLILPNLRQRAAEGQLDAPPPIELISGSAESPTFNAERRVGGRPNHYARVLSPPHSGPMMLHISMRLRPQLVQPHKRSGVNCLSEHATVPLDVGLQGARPTFGFVDVVYECSSWVGHGILPSFVSRIISFSSAAAVISLS